MVKPRTERSLSRFSRDGGSYLLLTAIFTLAFLGLCGLVFGSAILASSRVRLKNLANIASLSALNGYMSEPNPDSTVKVARSVAAVNSILARNSIPNSRNGHLDFVSGYPDISGDSGYLRFGLWYPTKPTCVNCGDPCTGTYPCFKDAVAGQSVNAVKTVLKTASNNPIVAPTQFLGGDEFSVEETSIASLVPRCVSLLLDVSTSSVEQTHHGDDPPRGYVAYRIIDRTHNAPHGYTDLDDAQSEFDYRTCLNKPYAPDDSNLDYWCAPVPEMPIKQNRSSYPFPIKPLDHFQDDYWYARTPISIPPELGPRKFMIDAYSFAHSNPPEPLTTFLRAFNAGAQEISEQSSSGDAIGVLPFGGQITSVTGMSSAVDLMRQLTNIRNAFPNGANYSPNNVKHPNFVDWNWFPLASDQGSNIIGALEQAYSQLINPSVCPSFAKKIIVLATDGLMNCVDTSVIPVLNCAREVANTPGDPRGPDKHDPQHALTNEWKCDALVNPWYPGTVDEPCVPCNGVNGLNTTSGRYDCRQDFVYYAVAERQIMDETSGVLKRFEDAGIAVTVLMSGEQTDPNFLNVGGPDGKYVNPDDAGPLGWDGLPYGAGSFSPFVHWTSSPNLNISIADANLDDETAFDNAGPNTPFFRPNGLLAELAFRTGGIFCPLLPQGNSGRYAPPDSSGVEYMTQAERAIDSQAYGGMQQTSITNRSITEQARDCVSKALGANPYALQDEWVPPAS